MQTPSFDTPKTFYVVGPTASGKSSLAIELALQLQAEIVNGDAYQLYRGLEICSAQPSPHDFSRVPHHLFGYLDLSENCDAARYAHLAQNCIQSIHQRGQHAIVVGGSGLYIKALTHGLSDLPSDAKLRTELQTWSAEQRVIRLLELDPQAEQNVNLRNDRYVSRALEICLLTGQPQSSLRQDWKQSDSPSYRGIRLHWEREHLLPRIQQRTLQMLEQGLIAEVEAATTLSNTASRAIGVPEVQAYLRGELDQPALIEAIAISTRQYARRQLKWFRRETGFQVLNMHPESCINVTLEQALQLLSAPSPLS